MLCGLVGSRDREIAKWCSSYADKRETPRRSRCRAAQRSTAIKKPEQHEAALAGRCRRRRRPRRGPRAAPARRPRPRGRGDRPGSGGGSAPPPGGRGDRHGRGARGPGPGAGGSFSVLEPVLRAYLRAETASQWRARSASGISRETRQRRRSCRAARRARCFGPRTTRRSAPETHKISVETRAISPRTSRHSPTWRQAIPAD